MSDLKYLFTDYLAPTIFGLKQNVRFCVRVCVRFNQFRSSVSFSLSDGEHTNLFFLNSGSGTLTEAWEPPPGARACFDTWVAACCHMTL